MKRAFRKIAFVVFGLVLMSCDSSLKDYDTTIRDGEIYSFMNFVIADLKIPDSVSIQKKPEVLFRFKNSDRGLNIVDFTQLKLHSKLEAKSDTVFIGIRANRMTVLNPKDTTFVLNQNNRLKKNFDFDLSEMGYQQSNNPMEVYFSLPYFTEDRQSAIISVSQINTSAFMAGSSDIIHYQKTEDGWKKKYLKRSLH